MSPRQKLMNRCLDDLETALLEYIEKYGTTEKAKKAISRLTIVRAAFENDLIQ